MSLVVYSDLALTQRVIVFLDCISALGVFLFYPRNAFAANRCLLSCYILALVPKSTVFDFDSVFPNLNVVYFTMSIAAT